MGWVQIVKNFDELLIFVITNERNIKQLYYKL